MISVGQDLHVRNSFWHARDESGALLGRGRCGNTLLEIGEFFGPLERRAKSTGEPIRVVMEATTNSRPMQRLLLEYGRQAGVDLTAQVLDARKIRIIAESVCKCDRLDAAVLSELAASNLRLPVCYMPDDDEFALREHLRARQDLVRMRTMLKNRVHAVLHRRGILGPSTDLFTRGGREFLRQLVLEEAGRTILDRFLSAMDQIEKILAESTGSLRELARQPRWAREAVLLQTMPGIGLITSLTILAELGDRKRFASRAAVANDSGLTPVCRTSDGKGYRGGITRRGSCHLRAVLCEASWVAAPRVPVYRQLFERIAGKTNKVKANAAVARRMLEDAYTMLKRNEPFRFVAMPASQAQDPEGALRPAGESRDGCKPVTSVAG